MSLIPSRISHFSLLRYVVAKRQFELDCDNLLPLHPKSYPIPLGYVVAKRQFELDCDNLLPPHLKWSYTS